MDTPIPRFHYVGVVGEAEASDLRIDAKVVDQQCDLPYLVGRAPVIHFWRDRVVLISEPPHTGAAVKWRAYPVGDAVGRVARPGDQIHVAGDISGHVHYSLHRDGELILAVGALVSVTFGSNVEVTTTGPGRPPRQVKVRIGNDERVFAARESAAIGKYDVYVEATYESRHESISVVVIGDDVLVNSARRAAVLMRADLDRLRGENLDGTFIRD